MTHKFQYASALGISAFAMASCHNSTAEDAKWRREYQEYQAFQAVCHAPPYTGPTETEPLPEGVKYIPCGDGYQFVLAWDDARSNGLAGAEVFARQHLKDLHERFHISSVGFGLCCDSDQAPPETRGYWCGRIEIVACSTTLPQFVQSIRDMRAADGAEVKPLGLSIRIDGVRNKGPRCLASDPKCGPSKPYRAQPYNPGLPRKTIENTGLGNCTHDGDCYPVGCEHEGCWAWELGQTFGTCYDTPRGPQVNMYCGCIEGKCSIFQQ